MTSLLYYLSDKTHTHHQQISWKEKQYIKSNTKKEMESGENNSYGIDIQYFKFKVKDYNPQCALTS